MGYNSNFERAFIERSPVLVQDYKGHRCPALALIRPQAEFKRGVKAARALLFYLHGKVEETGKKAEKLGAAEKSASGKFASRKPPVRLVP